MKRGLHSLFQGVCLGVWVFVSRFAVVGLFMAVYVLRRSATCSRSPFRLVRKRAVFIHGRKREVNIHALERRGLSRKHAHAYSLGRRTMKVRV